MISFLKSFGEVIVSSNLRETKGYSPGLFFEVRRKVMRKVNPFKVLEKRNCMALVSAAQHIQVGSCEHFKFLVHCTFEWGVKSVEQKSSYAKSKQATEPQT